MTDLQLQLLQLLEKFDVFCREQKIEYCLMWGTLLGCIREQGFIPWDDDVDVAMDRENFEKFKKLSRENRLPAGLVFEDTLFLKGCRIPKVRNKEVAVRDMNGGEGIFLDIFPMDRYTDFDLRVIEIATYGLRIRDYRRKISNKFLRLVYTPLSLIPYLGFVLVRKIYSGRKLNKGRYIGKSPNTNWEQFFTLDEFYPFERKKFETLELPVPSGWESILRKLYGNWWIPVNQNCKHY